MHAFFSSSFQNPASGVHFWMAAGLAGAAGLQARKVRYVSLGVPKVWRWVTVCALGLAIIVFGVRANARVVLADYHYARELACYYARNLTCGEAAFDRSVRYRPHHFAAYHVYGNMLYDVGAWDRAIEAYRRSLRYHPYNRNVHRLLGGALAQKGRYREAIEELEAAAALDPVFAPAQNDLGVYYRRLGDLEREPEHADRAVEHLEEAVALDPKNPEYLNNLGAAYATRGATEKGISCFRRALKQDPEYADARVNLGLMYEIQGSLQRAIRAFERAVESEPGHRVAHLRLTALFRRLGRHEEGEGLSASDMDAGR